MVYNRSAFTPPLANRLYGGLRGEFFTFPIEILEGVLGVSLKLEDDLELGGGYYGYEPYPLPDFGLTGVRLHINDIPDFGLTNETRPDLTMVLLIEYHCNNLLDLGRLEWRLRAVYGDLFDVSDYCIHTLPPPENPSHLIDVHCVQFAAATGRRGVPQTDTPFLACRLDFELAEGDEAALRATISSLDDTVAILRRVESIPSDDALIRLIVEFDSPSLLELGRYAQAIEVVFGDAVRILGYSVYGDLQRDGRVLCIEQAFTSRDDSLPFWDLAV